MPSPPRTDQALWASLNHALRLTSQETSSLQRAHILLPTESETLHKLSTAIFTPPPLQTSTTACVPIRFVRDPTTPESRASTTTIPQLPESISAYEFLGFSTPTATMLYARFMQGVQKWGYDTPNDVLAYARGHLSLLHTHLSRLTDSPRAAMDVLGIRADVQNALLDARHADVLQTRGLHAWLLDTVTTNHRVLISVLSGLKRGAVALRNGTALLSGDARYSAYTLPSPYRSVAFLPALRPAHVPLYKAWSPHDADARFPDLFAADTHAPAASEHAMRINMNRLATPAPPYLGFEWHASVEVSPQRGLAERERKWKARRNPHAETWMLRLEVSVEFLSGLCTREVLGDGFLELVRATAEQRGGRSRFEGVDLVVGNVARRRGEGVEVLRLRDGEECVKWTFHRDLGGALARQVQGKVGVEVYAPVVQGGE